MPLGACDDFDYLGWPDQPINVSSPDGIPMVPLSLDRGDEDWSRVDLLTKAFGDAIVDTSSPITVINAEARSEYLDETNEFGDYQLLVALGSRRGDLRLRDAERPAVSRFIFRDVRVFDLPVRPVGLGSSRPASGILGGDILTRFVVTLDYGASPSLTLGERLADTDEELSADCDERDILDPAAMPADCSGVLRASRYGGGTMLLGDEEVDLPATRLVLSACLLPEAFDPATMERETFTSSSGVPVSALISTGFGVSVIARSAFERLKARNPTLVEGGTTTLFLPSGQHEVTTAEIPRIALIDDLTVDLGPCQELARRRRLLLAHRDGLDSRDRDRYGAAAAEVDAPVTFAILADEAALLQGLRNELRPLVPDVDVVLGGDFFAHFVPTLDFPRGRVVIRCASPSPGCLVIPRCYPDDRQPRCPVEATP